MNAVRIRRYWLVHRSDVRTAAILLSTVAAVPAALAVLTAIVDYGFAKGWW